jgi:heptosyltransferase I
MQQNNTRGIDRIIPCALRRFKKTFFQCKQWTKNWSGFKQFLTLLREERYDLILDLQGLIKSALICALAKRTATGQIFGAANRTRYSGYEKPAQWFYTQKVQLPDTLHAVNRARFITEAALGISESERLKTPPYFYPAEFLSTVPETFLPKPYVLCFHATSRDNKRWSDQAWIELGKVLAAKGLHVIFPWGNSAEQKISMQLAAAVPGALVPNAFSITEAFAVIKGADLVVGVDTGLIHVAAALNQRVVEIYCHSYQANAGGFWSPNIKNLGDFQQVPSVNDVCVAIETLC